MAASRTSRAKNKNNMLYKDTRSGFTIIEVVLVLAIAGLIFLMVFIALPQLQRAQRDTQRREDVSKLRSAIETFKGNNNGRLPGHSTSGASACNDMPETLDRTKTGDACRLIYDYMHGVDDEINTFVDPGGNPYKIDIAACSATGSGTDCTVNTSGEGGSGMDYTMHVVTKATCDGEKAVSTQNPRDYAIVYRMEGSGTYCNS